jgi:hypothetical protein
MMPELLFLIPIMLAASGCTQAPDDDPKNDTPR